MDLPNMLVIGFGRMGRKFAEVFSERFDVYVASSRNVSDAVAEIGCNQAGSFSQAVSAAEYLFIAFWQPASSKEEANWLYVGTKLQIEMLSRPFGPAGSNLVKLIDHLRSNAPATYWESQICNPYTSEQRNRLVSAFAEYSDRLSDGDFPFFPESIRAIQRIGLKMAIL